MKKISLEQRSPEWHDYRKGKIGASMIGTIMGVNPYGTALQLYEELKGIRPPKEETEAMRKGSRLEENALAWASDMLGDIYFPAVVEHDTNKLFFASLDGLSHDDKNIIEIKCSAKALEAARRNEIPEYHIYQVQWQLMTTGLKKAYYVAYNEVAGVKDGNITEIKRESDEFMQKMAQFADNFLDCLMLSIPPAAVEADHVRTEIDKKQTAIIEHYFKVVEERKILELEEKGMKDIITSWSDDGNMLLCKDGSPVLKMTRIETKGRVDYEKLCEAHSITEDEKNKYRASQIGSWRLTRAK